MPPHCRKQKVAFFVDGFNVYHALVDCCRADPSHTCYKWFDLRTFLTKFIDPQKEWISDIYYFSAYFPWERDSHTGKYIPDLGKEVRHRAYREALENDGIHTLFGEFLRPRQTKCPCCHGTYDRTEEKRTDVCIGVTMLEMAVKRKYDIAILVSGDTDFVPALETIKRMYPLKKVGVLCPYKRPNTEYKKIVTFYYRKTKLLDYSNCKFPCVITRSDGTQITCPPSWL